MFLNSIMIKLIKKYQSNKNRHPRCRHIPNCSNYGLECYKKFNFIKASFLTSYRILRCNPLSRKVYDPVPLSKEEKKLRRKCIKIASLIDNSLIELYRIHPDNFLQYAISYIWINHFNSVDKIDLDKISDEFFMLFICKIERLIFLSKHKKIPFKIKEVKEYICQYFTSDIKNKPNI